MSTDNRLEAYFATLRKSSSKELFQRRMANWQLYATVTSSAMAMAANATAAAVSNATADATDPVPTYLATHQRIGTSQNTPMAKAVKAAVTADATSTPSISPGGVVPLYGTVSMIQPGEWISIYGTHLATTTAVWKGEFPTSLGGTTVEINGKPAYISYVSEGQIDVQAPDDIARGPVQVSVKTSAGQATSMVTLNSLSPAFQLSYKNFISGIILRSDRSGAYANGGYDILGPTGRCWGYPTVAAKAGDVVELFAIGFGPTNPMVAAGQVFSGAAPITSSITLLINNVSIVPTFVGLSSAGVYQINVVIPPGLGEGNVSVLAIVGGMQTQPGLLFALPGTTTSNVTACPVTGTGGTGGYGGGGGGGGTGFGGGGGGTGGTGGTGGGGGGGGTGGGGGGGGGTSARGGHMGRPYRPKLHFPPPNGK